MNIHDTRSSFIRKVIGCSRNFKNNVEENYQIVALDDVNVSMIEELYHLAIEFIMYELGQLGIRLIPDLELGTDVEANNIAVTLRKLFDKEHFKQLVDSDAVFRQMLIDMLSTDDVDDEVLATSIIEKYHEHNQLSLDWNLLYNNRYMFSCNIMFIRHLVAILSITDSSGPSDEALTNLSLYVQAVARHVELVKSVTEKLCLHPKINIPFKAFDFTRYDADLGNLSMEYIGLYLDESNPHPAMTDLQADVEFIKQHKRSQKHHFEYYKLRDTIRPEKTHLILLVAEHIVPGRDMDEHLARIMALATEAKFTDEDKAKLVEYIALYFASSRSV
jgi:hypothetical protein